MSDLGVDTKKPQTPRIVSSALLEKCILNKEEEEEFKKHAVNRIIEDEYTGLKVSMWVQPRTGKLMVESIF